jgi:hypothetical protein
MTQPLLEYLVDEREAAQARLESINEAISQQVAMAAPFKVGDWVRIKGINNDKPVLVVWVGGDEKGWALECKKNRKSPSSWAISPFDRPEKAEKS